MKRILNWLKAAAAKYNSTSLILRIFIGLVIGVILAIVLPGWTWLGELGNLFVGALKAVAPVLVFVLVSSALAQNGQGLDKRFGTVIGLYMLTTFLAAVLAVCMSFLFPQTIVLADAAAADTIPQGLGDVIHTLLMNIVANPVDAIAQANYIGILMWAVLFGFAMKAVASDLARQFMADVADAVSVIVRWVINLAPFGIMGLIFTTVSTSGLSIFTDYGKLLLLLVATMLIMALVVSPLVIFLCLRVNPYPLVFRCLRESGIPAFFTRSSAANIPVNMELCEKMGLDRNFLFCLHPPGIHDQYGWCRHYNHHHDAGCGTYPGH